MHYHCEIVLPEDVEDIDGAIASVLAPFDENQDDESAYAFWDWYVIGGRWAGEKKMSRYDKSRLDEFHQWMKKEGITVSSFVAGKQTLKPESQQSKVDLKWTEMFEPNSYTVVACPIFSHSNDQYYGPGLDGDICRLRDAMKVSCARIIFAGPKWTKSNTWDGPLEAVFMLTKEFYNGANWQDSTWDGSVRNAMEFLEKWHGRKSEEYRNALRFSEDWITVTVDYHS